MGAEMAQDTPVPPPHSPWNGRLRMVTLNNHTKHSAPGKARRVKSKHSRLSGLQPPCRTHVVVFLLHFCCLLLAFRLMESLPYKQQKRLEAGEHCGRF